MSYNLQSLITILQQILNPHERELILYYEKREIESLLEKAAALKQIHENSSIPKVESLETQIRDAAYKAEDIIESHMFNLMLHYKGFRFIYHTPDLLEVTQELDSAMKRVVELMEEKKISSGSSSSGAAFFPDPTYKNVVVGIDEDLLQLKDRLTGMQSQQLEIVPIVGMGGIGKTTLARNLYNDPLIVSHFEFRAWTTLSQDYNVRGILLGLLRRPDEKLSNELIECQDNELKEILHKRLYCRRYMIVLDDIWSTKCWDDIKWCFPDNNNGSRIVLTTRESDVARCVGTGGSQHELQLLEESESWNLLHQTVFGEEDCPYALEEIGRKIALDCGGLPLAINVIGGVLSKAEKEKSVWEHVSKDVRAAIAESDNHELSNVLSLSYNHLPNNLKPCFLYMGAFPEDYEMKASRLIKMLVAEGLLKSNGGKSLEAEAEDSLSALVERNLLLVRDKKSNGKTLSYGMHDLLREVCIRKADEEKFLHVKNRSEVRLDKLRRVSVETSCRLKDVDAHASIARSFICLVWLDPSLLFCKLRLVRVLDVYEMEFPEFPREIYQLVNLRYLAVSCKSGGIPNGISRLWNLQTLIARVKRCEMPSEIWEMSELRHLELVGFVILIEEGYMIKFVREKLQTISYVRINPSLMRRGFLESIPNIKKLGVYFDALEFSSEVVDLTHLHKLQTLRCYSNLNVDGCRFLLSTLRFPSSLGKLNLGCCVLFGRFMTTLCALPNLKVLKIIRCVFDEDEEWEVAEGDVFGSLRLLQLDELKLVRWRADETNFPRLRRLVIGDCPALEEIPSGIGEIPTLQEITMFGSYSPSAVASAKQIQELQQSEFDNYDLKLQLYDD
ncbi:hypothetical protein C2S53_012773 [Perilla frutescens var. hirtella]|uniref:NB-ARC domain-containing protein n=1 Tax=Perilla frutescens var. hirtella TaxID=608512 RepID=A0AAD4JDN7_PERFH|nr:hypothetical protein C2S53_012773 [Perilla frutescens var. hirtella]